MPIYRTSDSGLARGMTSLSRAMFPNTPGSAAASVANRERARKLGVERAILEREAAAREDLAQQYLNATGEIPANELAAAFVRSGREGSEPWKFNTGYAGALGTVPMPRQAELQVSSGVQSYPSTQVGAEAAEAAAGARNAATVQGAWDRNQASLGVQQAIAAADRASREAIAANKLHNVGDTVYRVGQGGPPTQVAGPAMAPGGLPASPAAGGPYEGKSVDAQAMNIMHNVRNRVESGQDVPAEWMMAYNAAATHLYGGRSVRRTNEMTGETWDDFQRAAVPPHMPGYFSRDQITAAQARGEGAPMPGPVPTPAPVTPTVPSVTPGTPGMATPGAPVSVSETALTQAPPATVGGPAPAEVSPPLGQAPANLLSADLAGMGAQGTGEARQPKGEPEHMGRTRGFVARMKLGDDGLALYARSPDLINFYLAAPGQGGFGSLVGYMLSSDEAKEYMNSAQIFLNSILRRDSGAAVPVTEYMPYWIQFIPMPGDSQQVIQQKAVARQVATQALQDSLPTGEDISPEQLLARAQSEVGVPNTSPRSRAALAAYQQQRPAEPGLPADQGSPPATGQTTRTVTLQDGRVITVHEN